MIRHSRPAPVLVAVDAPCEHPLDDAERVVLLNALEQQRWHMTHTAEQLGVSRNTLYRKLRKHGIAR
jgi:transcriptional regulator of acetoin/glycerol metabolism